MVEATQQPAAARFSRPAMVEQLQQHDGAYDVLVVGGGATGCGVALDAAQRGYRTLLVERDDFGKGTSSRSTKLVHGGVRYLAQGQIGLVRSALIERGRLLRNAPHLVYPLPTIVPLYRRRDAIKYWLGLKTYDLLSGKWSLGRSRHLSRDEALAEAPTLQPKGLRGGIRYLDAGFDDARLLLNIAQAAAQRGACLLNYAAVERLERRNGRISGTVIHDRENDQRHTVAAKVVVNCTGPFADAMRQLDDPSAATTIVPSQGAHLMIDRRFLPGETAIIVPETPDGRVAFAIPWLGHTLVGTTDIPLEETPREPRAQEEEIEFLLETIGEYLAEPPTRADVLSVFAGIRPLVRQEGSRRTAELERDHVVRTSSSGLISVMGGKWTTYRKMAVDAVDQAAEVGDLPRRPSSTDDLSLAGGDDANDDADDDNRWRRYGSAAGEIGELVRGTPGLEERLDDALPYVAGEVTWAVRYEMARTLEDVLSRRLRALLLNADAALRIAPRVAELMAGELGSDDAWVEQQLADFGALAEGYRCPEMAGVG